MKKLGIVEEFGLRIEREEADGQERVIRVIGRRRYAPGLQIAWSLVLFTRVRRAV